MGKTDLKERFIELRATGLSYSGIAGKSNEEVRQLVVELEAARKAAG